MLLSGVCSNAKKPQEKVTNARTHSGVQARLWPFCTHPLICVSWISLHINVKAKRPCENSTKGCAATRTNFLTVNHSCDAAQKLREQIQGHQPRISARVLRCHTHFFHKLYPCLEVSTHAHLHCCYCYCYCCLNCHHRCCCCLSCYCCVACAFCACSFYLVFYPSPSCPFLIVCSSCPSFCL